MVFLPLLAIDGALIVSRLLQPARLCASAIGMKNLRSTASGFRAPRASGVPHALFGREIHAQLERMARRGRKRAFAVIASAAKQSILPLRGKMDCFASLAMTARAMDCFAEPVIGRRFAPTRWLAMTTKRTFTTSPRHAPEALLESLAQRGRGKRCTFAWAAAKLPKVPGSQKRLSEDF